MYFVYFFNTIRYYNNIPELLSRGNFKSYYQEVIYIMKKGNTTLNTTHDTTLDTTLDTTCHSTHSVINNITWVNVCYVLSNIAAPYDELNDMSNGVMKCIESMGRSKLNSDIAKLISSYCFHVKIYIKELPCLNAISLRAINGLYARYKQHDAHSIVVDCSMLYERLLYPFMFDNQHQFVPSNEYLILSTWISQLNPVTTGMTLIKEIVENIKYSLETRSIRTNNEITTIKMLLRTVYRDPLCRVLFAARVDND